MIAIEIRMAPTVGNNHVSIADWIACINSEYNLIFDFFDSCINQNLIMTAIHVDTDGVADLTKYYAIDYEKANCFKQAFENNLLNFSVGQLSMKQFWNKFEFGIDFEFKEIDFINNIDLLDLVNYDTGEIWNTKFPLIIPYDHEGNLQ